MSLAGIIFSCVRYIAFELVLPVLALFYLLSFNKAIVVLICLSFSFDKLGSSSIISSISLDSSDSLIFFISVALLRSSIKSFIEILK